MTDPTTAVNSVPMPMLFGDKLVVAMDLDRPARSRSRANSVVPGTVVRLGTGSRCSSELVNYNSRLPSTHCSGRRTTICRRPTVIRDAFDIASTIFKMDILAICDGQVATPSQPSGWSTRMI